MGAALLRSLIVKGKWMDEYTAENSHEGMERLAQCMAHERHSDRH